MSNRVQLDWNAGRAHVFYAGSPYRSEEVGILITQKLGIIVRGYIYHHHLLPRKELILSETILSFFTSEELEERFPDHQCYIDTLADPHFIDLAIPLPVPTGTQLRDEVLADQIQAILDRIATILLKIQIEKPESGVIAP